jgi:hypothetical protein
MATVMIPAGRNTVNAQALLVPCNGTAWGWSIERCWLHRTSGSQHGTQFLRALTTPAGFHHSARIDQEG